MAEAGFMGTTMAVVAQETGEDQQFIYISPGGQRFTSLQQALQYAQNDKLRNRLNADMKALQMESFDHNSNIHVQFTSNHEDYMHCVEAIPSGRRFQRMSTICGFMVRASNPVKIPWETM